VTSKKMDGVISNNGYSFKLFFTHYHEVDHVAWFHALEIVSCRCCVYGCVKLPWTLSKINTSSCHERLKKKQRWCPCERLVLYSCCQPTPRICIPHPLQVSGQTSIKFINLLLQHDNIALFKVFSMHRNCFQNFVDPIVFGFVPCRKTIIVQSRRGRLLHTI
jgi:hypothetical protein